MITSDQFKEIKKYQQKGFTARRTARWMELSPTTVTKYYGMDEDEFEAQLERTRKIRFSSKCDQYRDELISLLKEDPSRSAAKLYNYLLEEYGKLPFCLRTIRRYTTKLKSELGISKQ